jgi:hypothetical protein
MYETDLPYLLPQHLPHSLVEQTQSPYDLSLLHNEVVSIQKVAASMAIRNE